MMRKTIWNFFRSAFATLAFIYISGLNQNNIYVLFVFAIVLLICEKVKTDASLFTKAGAFVFGVFATLSMFQINVYQEQLQELSFSLLLLKLVVIFAGVYFVAEMVLSVLYTCLDNHRLTFDNQSSRLRSLFVFAMVALVLIILYLPVWMIEYPSNLNPDNISQIKQIINGSYVNHHPFAHTMWLKLLMTFGSNLTQRVGIAALFQLFINCLVFSGVVTYVYKKTGKIFCAILAFLFYSLLSFHSFLSITLIKDVTHATVTCLLFIFLLEYFDADCTKSIVFYNLLIVLSVCFCLTRANGYFAYLIFTFFAILYLFASKDKKLILILITSLVFATILKGPVYTSLGIRKASYVESLSIPVQQIALLKKHGITFTDEQNELINKIVDVDSIGEKYEAFLSDPIKNAINDAGNVKYLEDHKPEYLKLWISLGFKYPILYVRAWVDQVSTFFSPTYYGTSLFWGITNNNLGIEGNSILIGDEVSRNLRLLAYNQHKIPVIGWFHYPAVTTWLMIVVFFYLLRNGKWNYALVVTPLIGLFLTLMISCPYNICFRYYYAVVCCAPLLLLMLVSGRKGAVND